MLSGIILSTVVLPGCSGAQYERALLNSSGFKPNLNVMPTERKRNNDGTELKEKVCSSRQVTSEEAAR